MNDRPIRFTRHALEQMSTADRRGFTVNQAMVLATLRNPQQIVPGKFGRLIAQSPLDEVYLLRVVFEAGEEIVVVTAYPARRARYENQI